MEFRIASSYPHQPLISALTTFYTLLLDLRYIPASVLRLPSTETGFHPPRSINHRAAFRHGFSIEAVNLAYQLPYLINDDYKIYGETTSLYYLIKSGEQIPEDNDEYNPQEQEAGEDSWEFAKDPTFQDRDDLFTNCNALVLTRGNVYGTELIYDLDKRTITAWNHFSGSESWTDHPAYSMTSAHNPLYRWISSFLTLEYIPFGQEIMFPLSPEGYGHPGDDAWEEEIKQWERWMEKERKERGLKMVYVDCGWKIDTSNYLKISEDDGNNIPANEKEQDKLWEKLEQAREKAAKDFNGNLFLEQRDKYIGDVYAEMSDVTYM